MEHDPTPEYPEGEYGVIDLTHSWHVASLLCFVAALGSRFLVAALPREVLPLPRTMMPGLLVLILAVMGLSFGLVGVKRSHGNGAAKVGVFLNAVVLVLGSVAAFLVIYIRP